MMKKIFAITTLALLPALATQAQAPNDVQDFKSHGIHVILRSTKSNQVVSAVLGFEGGLAYGEADNAALAGMTAAVITKSGSDKFPKTAYRDSLARLSTAIAGSGSFYHTTFTMQTVRPNFSVAWDIFSDLLLHPHYDTLEASKIAEQEVKAIESRETEPESYTSFLADSLWEGASKLNRVATTEEVEKLTPADFKAYRDAQLQRSRAVLVVVGDVSKAELEAKLASLEALPMGNFTWPKVEHITPVTGKYMFIPKPADFPTTYVEMRGFSATPVDPDWFAERILIEVLDKRYFDEIRTKRNLSYAPGIYPNGEYSNFAMHSSFQSVLPDSAARVAFRELRKVQTELVPADQLMHSKEGRITTYYYATQSNLSQATAMFTDQVEYGDWHIFFQIVPKTETVTAEQVRAAAKKYLRGFSFVVLGPEGKATQDVYKFE